MPDIPASKSLAPNADTGPLEPLICRSKVRVPWGGMSQFYYWLWHKDQRIQANSPLQSHENHRFQASRQYYKSSPTSFIIYRIPVSISKQMYRNIRKKIKLTKRVAACHQTFKYSLPVFRNRWRENLGKKLFFFWHLESFWRKGQDP